MSIKLVMKMSFKRITRVWVVGVGVYVGYMGSGKYVGVRIDTILDLDTEVYRAPNRSNKSELVISIKSHDFTKNYYLIWLDMSHLHNMNKKLHSFVIGSLIKKAVIVKLHNPTFL